MGTLNDNVKAQVKRPLFRKGQMAGYAADIHVFGTKEEKLFFFQDMGHVIIRTIPTVSYEDIRSPLQCLQTVYHSAESLELIFEMNRLDDSIHISMRVKVIKGIQMKAVEAFRGMAPGDKILIRSQLWSTEKGER